MELQVQGSSAAPDTTVSDGSQQEQKKDSVSYETHRKLLGQLQKQKEMNDELSRKLQGLSEAEQTRETQKLVEAGEFKKIIELRERELNEMKQKLTNVTSERDQRLKDLADTWKLQAFYEKLPGKIKKREYLGFVPLDNIAWNPDTNEIDSQSVDSAVNMFMESHPDLVDTSSFRSLPGSAPRASSSNLSAENFKNLSLKEMKENISDAVRKRKHELGYA